MRRKLKQKFPGGVCTPLGAVYSTHTLFSMIDFRSPEQNILYETWLHVAILHPVKDASRYNIWLDIEILTTPFRSYGVIHLHVRSSAC